MAPSPKPAHPLVAVFAAVLATLCFTTSSTVHSGLRWVLMAVGFALLVMAIAGIAATKRGAPESGWLPSRDQDER